ncbi:MAG: DNA alkylation repair protein [Chloroflexi bacterium]|nr:DNA alkylation repair protein [Chloroflexota bacterium]
MARYGIRSRVIFGVPVQTLRAMARRHSRDHALAEALWASGVMEARILATLTDVPTRVTLEQMERWVADPDSWAICDACCGNLFDRTPFAHDRALAWSSREEEYVRRAGYVMMAELTVHDHQASDERFADFLPVIVAGATDERNFVKKAVNWALRQIGKRSLALNERAIETAIEIQRLPSRSARWIAADALRELRSEVVQQRLRSRALGR